MTGRWGPIVVTGAGGFVGSHVVAALTARGDQVRATRHGMQTTAPLIAPAVPRLPIDLIRPETLRGLCDGAGAVIHCAARISVPPGRRRLVWRANADGTRNLLAEAVRGGVRRVVLVSSISVYGRPVRLPVAEDHPTRPVHVYGRSKLRAEQHLRAYCRAGVLEGVIVRLGWTYGPNDRRTLPLFAGVAAGRVPLIGRRDVSAHPVYVDDAVAGILAALEIGGGSPVAQPPRTAKCPAGMDSPPPVCHGRSCPAVPDSWSPADRVWEIVPHPRAGVPPPAVPRFPGAEAFNVAGPEVTTVAGLVRAIASAAGVPPPRHLPHRAALALAAVGQAFGTLFGRRMPMDLSALGFFLAPEHWDISKAQRLLGFRPRVGVAEGVRRTLDWYARHRWMR